LNVTPPEREPTSVWSLVIRECVEPITPEGQAHVPSGATLVLRKGIPKGRQASEYADKDVCGLRRPERMAPVRLGQDQRDGEAATGAYGEGNTGRRLAQGDE